MREQIRFFLHTEILTSLVKPVFEGDCPPFIPEDEYLALREDIYRDLAAKYYDKENFDKPF